MLTINPGGHYGWPFWYGRGCLECPLPQGIADFQPDLLPFPDYTIPRGLVAYTGQQFPQNLFNQLFVVLWNANDYGQRVVLIDPATPPQPPNEFEPAQALPFITGLIRPIDITLAPAGALVVGDYL